MPVIQIFADLFLSVLIISFPPPYLKLYDILLTEVVHNHIHSCLVTGFGLYIVIAGSVNNELKIEKKQFPPVLFFESVDFASWFIFLIYSETY